MFEHGLPSIMQAEDRVNKNRRTRDVRPETVLYDQDDNFFAADRQHCQGGRWSHAWDPTYPDGRLSYACPQCGAIVTIIKNGKSVVFV